MTESRDDEALIARLTSYLDGYGAHVSGSSDRAAAPAPATTTGPDGHRHHRLVQVVGAVLAVVVALGAASAVLVLRASHSVPAKPSTTAPHGWRTVSYQGVHIDVPTTWPVVDGMHTLLCGDPFPTTPTVFVGANDSPAPGCPFIPAPGPARDGAWLQPAGALPPPDARPVTTTSGQRVFEQWPGPEDTVAALWYHGILVEVGIGPKPEVAKTIVNSIGFSSGASDTVATGVCARSANPAVMPMPERETQTLVLNRSEVTLDPPLPSDQPAIAPAQVWDESAPKSAFELYHVILARYSARFPARQNPDGSLTPLSQHELAWVIYATPFSTGVAGCGAWGADVFDALSGQVLTSSEWDPGP